MNSEEKRLLIERFVYAYNSFNLEAMVALLDEAVQFRTIVSGEVTAVADDSDAFYKLSENLSNLYSSRKLTVLEYHEKQGKIIAETACTIVEAGSVENTLTSEKTLTFKGFTEFVLREGKIIKITEFFTPVLPEDVK